MLFNVAFLQAAVKKQTTNIDTEAKQIFCFNVD